MAFFAVEMKGKKGTCSCGMLAPKAGKAKNKLCAKGKGKASSVYKRQGKPKGKVKGLPKKYAGDAATYVGCYPTGAVESLKLPGTLQGDGVGAVTGGPSTPAGGGCVGQCSTAPGSPSHFMITFPASGGKQECTCLAGAPTAKKKGLKECARKCIPDADGIPGKETCGDVGRAVVYELAGGAPPPPVDPVDPVPAVAPLAYPTPAPLAPGDVGAEGQYLGFDSTYLGCFPDPASDETGAPVPRLLDVKLGKYQDGLLTPEICKTACQNSGIDFGLDVVYDMFGLQNGKECWCGSSASVSLPAAVPGGVDSDVTDCDKPCGGAPELNCGGVDLNVIYVTEDDEDIGTVDLLQEPAPVSTTYAGCFQNLDTGKSFSFLDSSKVMSASICGAACKAAKPDSEVFAVELGKECWCDFAEGVTGADLVKVPTDYCRTGPDAESCGGFNGGKTYAGLSCGGSYLADVYTFGADVIPDLPTTIPPPPAAPAPASPVAKALPPPPLP